MASTGHGPLREKKSLKERKVSSIEIAFLGSGNMAEAIIKGLLDAGLYKPEALLASDPSEKRLTYLEQSYKIGTTHSNREAVRAGQSVVLGVKPNLVSAVLAEIRSELAEKLLISVAAGVPLSRLASVLEREAQIIRAMPNAPAQVQAGATVLAPAKGVDEKHLKQALKIFDSVGKTWVLEEHHLDAVTGLSGSGPAFAFMMMEALADGGVKEGLPRKIAIALAAQTVLGAAKMILETGEHPAQLKDFVASPGGTTISGLHRLEEAGCRAAFIGAVEAASQRSRKLGES